MRPILIALALLLTAPAAEARPHRLQIVGNAATPQTRAWVRDARAYWGVLPPCGHRIRLFLHAAWQAYGEVADAAEDRCVIYITPGLADPQWTDEQRCNAIAHEYGHLLLLNHERSDPRSVMYYRADATSGWTASGLIPACAI